ncbi:hypothetical protein AAFF_G00121300 [Aldrovandia affinis]|uniref:Uncharacterized protein n=1 Tax=Aldrovandia affinis TaxID=143900 RepID=A0AAD7WAB7_9TELE|nr:hypothetical protein AAFF_G00121300 [Aldrovandia affinis]
MELLLKSCDPRLEFCEAMAQWFRNYEARSRCAGQQKGARNKGRGQVFPKLPLDCSSPHWLLLCLDCAPPSPEAQSWLSRVNIDQSDVKGTGVWQDRVDDHQKVTAAVRSSLACFARHSNPVPGI